MKKCTVFTYTLTHNQILSHRALNSVAIKWFPIMLCVCSVFGTCQHLWAISTWRWWFWVGLVYLNCADCDTQSEIWEQNISSETEDRWWQSFPFQVHCSFKSHGFQHNSVEKSCSNVSIRYDHQAFEERLVVHLSISIALYVWIISISSIIRDDDWYLDHFVSVSAVLL